jgi:hypothetical protein
MGGLAPNALWSHAIGGPQEDLVRGLAVAGDGSVVVAGTFSGTIDPGAGPLTSAGNEDIFVVRYAPDGALISARRHGGAEHDTLGAVAFDPAGNLVIAGSCGGDVIDLGGGPLSCGLYGGSFLAKLEPDGDVLWRRGPSLEFGLVASMSVDAAGDIVIFGSCGGGADCDLGGGPLPGFNGPDLVLAKLSAAGDHLWSKRFADANPAQLATSVVVGPSGSIHVAGSFGPYPGEPTVDFGGGPATPTES